MKILGLDPSDAANLMTVFQPVALLLFWLITHNRFQAFWQRGKSWIISVSIITSLLALWARGWLAWLAATVSLPIWVIILAAILILAAIGIILVQLLAKIKQPSQEDYRSDLIFGIQWRWRYNYRMIETCLIDPFCPNDRCMSRLSMEPDYSGIHSTNTIFWCPNCDFKCSLNGNETQVKQRVAVEIERRLNTGEFVQALK